MEFDRYTIALSILRPDAPQLPDADAGALQDAHMAHLADLHEEGHLLAAGPLLHDTFRGLSILNVDPDRARLLKEQDPAVVAGRLSIETMAWLVPSGLVAFSSGAFRARGRRPAPR